MEVGDGSEGPSVVDKQLILSVNFKKCEIIMRISLYVARDQGSDDIRRAVNQRDGSHRDTE